jgi:hypothetical protein
MEDIVAVRVTLTSGRSRYFLTWGRIPEAIDPQPLLAIVRDNLDRFDLGGEPKAVDLCPTLQEASGAPYFFEALFQMGQKPIPFGPGYKPWRKRMLLAIQSGSELYYLGRRRRKGISVGTLRVSAQRTSDSSGKGGRIVSLSRAACHNSGSTPPNTPVRQLMRIA